MFDLFDSKGQKVTWLEKECVHDLINRTALEDEEKKNLHETVDGLAPSDVARVVRGKWVVSRKITISRTGKLIQRTEYQCNICGYKTGQQAKKFICCPICTARMEGFRNRDEYDDPISPT